MAEEHTDRLYPRHILAAVVVIPLWIFARTMYLAWLALIAILLLPLLPFGAMLVWLGRGKPESPHPIVATLRKRGMLR